MRRERFKPSKAKKWGKVGNQDHERRQKTKQGNMQVLLEYSVGLDCFTVVRSRGKGGCSPPP